MTKLPTRNHQNRRRRVRYTGAGLWATSSMGRPLNGLQARAHASESGRRSRIPLRYKYPRAEHEQYKSRRFYFFMRSRCPISLLWLILRMARLILHRCIDCSCDAAGLQCRQLPPARPAARSSFPGSPRASAVHVLGAGGRAAEGLDSCACERVCADM